MQEMTVPEAAIYLNVKELAIRIYIKNGKIKARKIPKGLKYYYLIDKSSLDEIKNKQK